MCKAAKGTTSPAYIRNTRRNITAAVTFALKEQNPAAEIHFSFDQTNLTVLQRSHYLAMNFKSKEGIESRDGKKESPKRRSTSVFLPLRDKIEKALPLLVTTSFTCRSHSMPPESHCYAPKELNSQRKDRKKRCGPLKRNLPSIIKTQKIFLLY